MKPVLPSLALAALLCAACDRRRDVGPVIVSAISERSLPADGARGEAERILAGATAQGLVRFDADGQIEPGLAERWIVIDDGRSYIFRIRAARWADGRAVTGNEIATALERRLAARARNPLASYLTSIAEVVAMTSGVIEIRLDRPRPDLLKLFAQPEMAIVSPRSGGGGTGPFRRAGGLLHPVAHPERAADEQLALTAEDDIRLIRERAARAIVRFAARRSDLVTGGTIADWPLIRHADLAPADIRLDPAAGLFGLIVANRDGFLGDVANRSAIARAIDRGALTAAVARQWDPVERILPDRLDSAEDPAPAMWASEAAGVRRIAATQTVGAWRARHGAVALRIALPEGPGGTLLWGRIAADLFAIGIRPVRVGWRAPADLRLIDAVAPFDSARWYLATACAPCGDEAAAAIEAARMAPTLADRARALALADAALAQDGGYIPIARPFRWSLVAFRLRAWRPNARAWHPLNHLREAPK